MSKTNYNKRRIVNIALVAVLFLLVGALLLSLFAPSDNDSDNGELQAKYDTLQTDYNSLDASFQELSIKFSRANSINSTLNNDLNNANDRISTLELENSAKDDIIAAKDAEIAALNENVDVYMSGYKIESIKTYANYFYSDGINSNCWSFNNSYDGSTLKHIINECTLDDFYYGNLVELSYEETTLGLLYTDCKTYVSVSDDVDNYPVNLSIEYFSTGVDALDNDTCYLTNLISFDYEVYEDTGCLKSLTLRIDFVQV